MKEVLTSDLAKFGPREMFMLKDLLVAMHEQGLPNNFARENVHPVFNMDSGYVFLTNDEFEVAMINRDKLEKWHYCSYCGHEGFLEDFKHEAQNDDCIEQMQWAGIEKGDK